MNGLDIIKDKNNREMFETIEKFLGHLSTGMTPIQIEYFVLNEIEFPTSYSKFMQVKLELASRYARVVELYYKIRKTKAKIDIKVEAINAEKSKAKRSLLETEREELEMKVGSLNAQLKTIIEETKIFFAIYERFKDFAVLSPEEKTKLEIEMWSAKARNMPHIFEERYGASFMKTALGQSYSCYLEARRKNLGLLPRELLTESIPHKLK